MLTFDIPGHKKLTIQHIVCDYNGTLAVDGTLIADTGPLIQKLATDVDIHVITADTFGLARKNLRGLPVTLTIMPLEAQDVGKLAYIKNLGPENVASLGNGRNDQLMLKEAALGICLLLTEGACVSSLMAADIACRSALDALELFTHPKRLIATLRK